MNEMKKGLWRLPKDTKLGRKKLLWDKRISKIE